MKVIFLDHDGVICLSNNWGSRFKKKPGDPFANFDNFDKKAIKVLNEILLDTDAEIVISSDWKYHHTLEEMRNFYAHQGIIKLPIDFTPRIGDLVKGEFPAAELEIARVFEIKSWLAAHPEVTQWVAVDDLYMGDPQFAPSGRRAIYLALPDRYKDFLVNFVHTPRSTEGIKQLSVMSMITSYLESPVEK